MAHYLFKVTSQLLISSIIVFGCGYFLAIGEKYCPKRYKWAVRVVFAAYIMGVLYLTLLSRRPGIHIQFEYRACRISIYMFSLLKKFLNSCWLLFTTGVWNKLQEPDVDIVYVREGLLNIIMFVPFGYLIPIALCRVEEKRYVLMGIIGFTISLTIEMIQMITHLGAFDLDDLLHNTVGTVIGNYYFQKIMLPVFVKNKTETTEVHLNEEKPDNSGD